MVATDLSAQLLAMLSEYLREAAASDRVVCVQMDAMKDHVTPAAFDLVTGASILHHLVHPDRGVAVAARALKPGGHAIFFEPFHGWAVLRLAFERVLVEAELRGAPLERSAGDALRGFVQDVAGRTRPDRNSARFAEMDDKWLFSRAQIENAARASGFSEVRFVPHNDHATLYRDATRVHLRLSTGRDDVDLPDWAWDVIDNYDDALTLQAKRELMIEGTIVLTKGSG